MHEADFRMKVDSEISEITIWNRFREGDTEAFSLLYDLYVDEMYRYGMKIVSDRDKLTDAIHDVFVKLFSAVRLPSDIRSPKAYLFRSLRGQIYDNMKKAGRIPSTSLDNMPFNVEWRLSDDAACERENRAETEEKYRRALSIMTDRQKEAVYLHYSLGFSFEETAALMDMNVQSVRNLMSRALAKVRKVMSLAVFLSLFV